MTPLYDEHQVREIILLACALCKDYVEAGEDSPYGKTSMELISLLMRHELADKLPEQPEAA